jgi:serine/threonine-protein kinase
MLERYRLTRLVATGGMAEVFLGMAHGAEGFQKPVVLKRMHPHLAQDPRVAAMFLEEARVSRHLHHQNIVEVLDLGQSPDGLFLVMELVDGWSLDEIAERAQAQNLPFSGPLAAFVGLQVLAGLEHAYRRTENGKRLVLAHRDISTSNLLVSVEGEVKLADFGIAKLEEATAKTEPGSFKGKVGYLAPEVLSGQPATEASDQFALGVVLYEMVAGRPPFGNSRHLITYVQALQGDPAPLAPELHLLEAIVRRMLAREPSARFPQEALSLALSQYLASTGIPTSSRELTAFVRRLSLPPPFSERPGLPGGLPQGRFDTRTSQPGFSLDDEAEGDHWQPSGTSLRMDGGLEILPPPQASRGEPPPVEPTERGLKSLASATELELEQVPRPVAPDSDPEALSDFELPERPRTGRWPVVAAFFLGLLLLAGGLAWRFANPPAPAKAYLYLDSEPPGATVRINGEEIGQTPLVQENLYPPGATIQIELRLKGYRSVKSSFRGGEPVTLRFELIRR